MLSDADWKFAQENLPIVCVDLLPVQRAGGEIKEVGLIYRTAPVEEAWCLLGGRMMRDESIEGAAHRIVTEALGTSARLQHRSWSQPNQVVEYFPHASGDLPHDPRKHAVGLTYVVELEGEITPGGEALMFRWYKSDSLPSAIGFGQADIIKGLLLQPSQQD